MDVSMVVQLIGSLGFPIVACGALFYSMNKEQISHKEEVDRLSTVLENNTIAITKLCDKLDGQ